MSREATITKIGEETKVSLSLKNLVWIIGIIITIIMTVWGWIYKQMNDDMDELKLQIDKYRSERKEWVDKDFRPHIKEFNEMYKNIGILIERTNNLASKTNSTGIHNLPSEKPN